MHARAPRRPLRPSAHHGAPWWPETVETERSQRRPVGGPETAHDGAYGACAPAVGRGVIAPPPLHMFSSGAPGASCRPLALTFSSEPTRGRDTASASARTLSESNTESENSQPNTADSPALCIRYPVCGFLF